MKHRFSPAFVITGIVLSFVCAFANTPPVASFEVRSSADGSQTTLIFDATSSLDPDGAIGSYQWVFGDGYSGSGATKTHTFPAVSTYDVMLLVRDNNGANNSVTQTIDLALPITPLGPPGEEAAPVVPNADVPFAIPIGNRSGERAPAFALLNEAGEIVQLADYLGQLVLVEFWTSSCSACQASMPHLEALRAEFANRGLVVITITINRNVEGEWQYLAQNGYTQFVSLAESDPIGRPTKSDYNVSSIPYALLIDPQGVIRFAGHINLVRSDTIEALL
ncbi:PKD domain-containing protein [Candidatus Bipolaricaulota bacterium]